jgi:hypothetical protein
MKRDFERFNLDRCLNYNIYAIILITTCKLNPIKIMLSGNNVSLSFSLSLFYNRVFGESL